jgi:pyrimidine operon attenuation protein/uracil phosphoribosyltransferase
MAGQSGDAFPRLPDAAGASADGNREARTSGGWARPRLELLGSEDLRRTIDRLASQVLEKVPASSSLVLLGIPTRGVALARVLAERLERLCGHPIACGSLDPTFHRDDLARVGTRMVEPTQLPVGLDDAEVVLVDDVIFTGRTVRAALEALQAWGRPRRVHLVAMVDRGHRELPIQPDFCGRVVPTTRQESIQVCLQAIDGEEGVFLLRPDGGSSPDTHHPE